MMSSASVKIIRSGAGIFLKVNWVYFILYLIAAIYLNAIPAYHSGFVSSFQTL
jgi:hypothetical protein